MEVLHQSISPNHHSHKDINKFSLFTGGITNVTPKETIEPDELPKICGALKELTAKMVIAEPEEKAKFKLQQLYFTPCGVFTSRENKSVIHHNSNGFPLDFDKMGEDKAKEAKAILAAHQSCLLTFISGSQKGAKSLILLEDAIPLEKHYETLKANAPAIMEALGMSAFIPYMDYAQFKLSQTMFLSSDESLHFNPEATPLSIKLTIPETALATSLKVREWDSSISEYKKARIIAYTDKAVENLGLAFEAETGARYPTIVKVKGIAELHKTYNIPGESENYERLKNSIATMYGGDSEAKTGNAYKSLNDAWKKAEPLTCESIEFILLEDDPTPAQPMKPNGKESYSLMLDYLKNEGVRLNQQTGVIEINGLPLTDYHLSKMLTELSFFSDLVEQTENANGFDLADYYFLTDE